MIVRIAKSCAITVYENPREGWRFFLLVSGTLATYVLACVIFALIGLYEKLTNKDFLN